VPSRLRWRTRSEVRVSGSSTVPLPPPAEILTLVTGYSYDLFALSLLGYSLEIQPLSVDRDPRSLKPWTDFFFTGPSLALPS
jgi:hypothetical protein